MVRNISVVLTGDRLPMVRRAADTFGKPFPSQQDDALKCVLAPASQ